MGLPKQTKGNCDHQFVWRETKIPTNKKTKVGKGTMLTVNQRDLLALYCLAKGIQSESNVKKQLEEYERIRQIVGKLGEENVQEESRTETERMG